MRRFCPLALFAVLSFSHAQEAAPTSIAFVRSSQVLAAHPAGQAAEELGQQARTELQEIAATLQPLQAKANSGQELTAEEQNQLELTQRTFEETRQRYEQDVAAAAQPATEEINGIIQRIAAEEGYTLVMNYDVAQTSQLVVFADPESVPDITEQVIAEIQGANPGGAEGGN